MEAEVTNICFTKKIIRFSLLATPQTFLTILPA